jgi:hypothetical protein
MITLQQTSLLSELRQKPIPEATLIELEARLQHRIHSMVLDAFNESGLSQKELADRLGWDTARVSRCLGTSGNWTLKTISALLAAIRVDLDDPSYTSFDELEQRLQRPAKLERKFSGESHRETVVTFAGAVSQISREVANASVTAALIGMAAKLAQTVQIKIPDEKLDWLKYNPVALGEPENRIAYWGNQNAR